MHEQGFSMSYAKGFLGKTCLIFKREGNFLEVSHGELQRAEENEAGERVTELRN